MLKKYLIPSLILLNAPAYAITPGDFVCEYEQFVRPDGSTGIDSQTLEARAVLLFSLLRPIPELVPFLPTQVVFFDNKGNEMLGGLVNRAEEQEEATSVVLSSLDRSKGIVHSVTISDDFNSTYAMSNGVSNETRLYSGACYRGTCKTLVEHGELSLDCEVEE